MDIYSEFEKFQMENKGYLEKLDGLNGDCKKYSIILANYLKENKYAQNIATLNYGVHYWVEVDEFELDCRRVFKKKEKIYKDFLKYVKKPKITYKEIE